MKINLPKPIRKFLAILAIGWIVVTVIMATIFLGRRESLSQREKRKAIKIWVDDLEEYRKLSEKTSVKTEEVLQATSDEIDTVVDNQVDRKETASKHFTD